MNTMKIYTKQLTFCDIIMKPANTTDSILIYCSSNTIIYSLKTNTMSCAGNKWQVIDTIRRRLLVEENYVFLKT